MWREKERERERGRERDEEEDEEEMESTTLCELHYLFKLMSVCAIVYT